MNYLQSGFSDNWFVVDGCWAQPEGAPEEWREILVAMRSGLDKHFTRVGVYFQNGYATIYSPRNRAHEGDDILLSPDELEDWISNAELTLKEHFQEVKDGEAI